MNMVVDLVMSILSSAMLFLILKKFEDWGVAVNKDDGKGRVLAFEVI